MKTIYLKLAILALVNLSAVVGIGSTLSSESAVNTKDLERPWNLVKTSDVGVGVKWGNFTGIDVKYWIAENKAWDFTIAFADNNTIVGVDYLVHFRDVTAKMIKDRSAQNIAPYFGVGMLSSFGNNKSNTTIFDHEKNNINGALRVPIGVEYLPTNIRLSLFAELGLGFGIIPTTYTFATGDVGARFYF